MKNDIVNNSIISVKINIQRKMQIMEGWGTSLSWWANAIGKWKSESKINEIADLLFDTEKGLGINIARYNIGGGENPPNVKNLRIGADIPCYQPSQGKWDWETDKSQRKILFKARDRGADIFEAFLNTPPVWMTKNGSTAGADDRRNNLREDKYGEFAEFITEVIKHFRDLWGINFRTLSPFNEPISCWWHNNNDQEGCFFDSDKQIEIINEVVERLKYKGLKDTTIASPEGWSVFDSIYLYGCYNNEIKSHISQINTHAYSGDTKSRLFLRSLAEQDKKRLWMSEATCGGDKPHNHNDMSSALELARMIRDYLVELNAEAWVYWQAVEDEAGNHNHGLIHANFWGTEDYWITKQYYAFANFSKFIRKGAVILDSKDDNIVAAYNEKESRLILVFINDGEIKKEFLCDLSSFRILGKNVAVYKTSENDNLAKDKDIFIINKSLKLDVAAKSIYTYLVEIIQP